MLPEPSLTVTQYSSGVSGNIGEPVPGVGVAVTLERSNGGGTSSSVITTDTTRGDVGGWTADLAPYAVAGVGPCCTASDTVSIHY